MASQAYKLDAHWRARQESTASCAERLARMLEGLAKVHRAFAHWNKQANSRAAANQPAWPMPPEVDELAGVFEKGRQYKDFPREPWPEMGYSVAAWNGLKPPYSAALSVWPGSYSVNRTFPNSVEMEFDQTTPANADLMCAAVLKSALLSIAVAWEADYGNVVCWDYWRRLFGGRHYPLFRSGWMTYLAPQYASRITPPPAAIVEPLPGGGLLLLATTERFSMDNPAHLAAADAIQNALAPLQAMFPANRDLPLPHNPAS